MSIFGTPQTSLKNAFASGGGSVSSDPINTAIGDLLVACVFGSGLTGASIGVTDTAGNLFAPRTLTVDGSSGQGFQFFWCIATHASASNVVTGAFSAGFIDALGVLDFPISGGTPSFDTDTAFGANVSVTNLVSPNFNIGGADELIIAAESDSGSEPTITAGTGYTLVSAASLSFARQNMVWGLFSGPTSGVAASLIASSAFSCDVAAIAFNSGGGGGAAAQPVVCVMQ